MCNLYSITTNQAAALPLAGLSSRGRRWKTELEARVIPIDPWDAAQRTAAKTQPPVKWCIMCEGEFTRLYRDLHGKPRLRSPKDWRKSLYCSRACASLYRRSKRNAGRLRSLRSETLSATLQALESN